MQFKLVNKNKVHNTISFINLPVSKILDVNF
jgi:hypothetical protein